MSAAILSFAGFGRVVPAALVLRRFCLLPGRVDPPQMRGNGCAGQMRCCSFSEFALTIRCFPLSNVEWRKVGRDAVGPSSRQFEVEDVNDAQVFGYGRGTHSRRHARGVCGSFRGQTTRLSDSRLFRLNSFALRRATKSPICARKQAIRYRVQSSSRWADH